MTAEPTMSDRPRTGSALDQYRIVVPLGAGGMSEVFHAHDSKLARAVAIKILPESVVRDARRVRRFVQEARSASSLSHPNIVHDYDIGEAAQAAGGQPPGAGAAAVHQIAMELVEGRTLRQLFQDRSIEPSPLLRYHEHSDARSHRGRSPDRPRAVALRGAVEARRRRHG